MSVILRGRFKNPERAKFRREGYLTDQMFNLIVNRIREPKYTFFDDALGWYSEFITQRDLALLSTFWGWGLVPKRIRNLKIKDVQRSGQYLVIDGIKRFARSHHIRYLDDWLNTLKGWSFVRDYFLLFPAVRGRFMPLPANTMGFVVGASGTLYEVIPEKNSVYVPWIDWSKPMSERRLHQIVIRWDNRLTPYTFRAMLLRRKARLMREVEAMLEQEI